MFCTILYGNVGEMEDEMQYNKNNKIQLFEELIKKLTAEQKITISYLLAELMIAQHSKRRPEQQGERV